MVTPPLDDAARLVLSFEGGEMISVALHKECAPKTCAAIRRRLPVEETIYHSRWSGREVNVSVAVDPTIPPKNRMAHSSVGDIVYWRDWDLPADEAPKVIAVYYGPETMRGPQGQLSVNTFGRVPPKHWETLETVGERIWREGGERLTLRLGEA